MGLNTKEDLLRARHRLTKFLLRHGVVKPEGIRTWSDKYLAWLKGFDFGSIVLNEVFREYVSAIGEVEERIRRLEADIHAQARESVHSPVIQALQTLLTPA